jgi:hypothetical protein
MCLQILWEPYTTFFDVAQFIAVTRLSFLVSRKPLFLIVSLQISSLTFALKSSNNIFMLYLGN